MQTSPPWSTSQPARCRGHMQPLEQIANQVPPLQGHNAFDADPALRAALEREGAFWAIDRAREVGQLVASEEAQAHSKRAQTNIPKLLTHDRYGNRIDAIDYDP